MIVGGTRMRWGVFVASTAILCVCSVARADRYEATIAVRPSGQLARLADRYTDRSAVVAGAGVTTAVTWGVRNWLDLGAELTASSYEKASHDEASVVVASNTRTGALTRTTSVGQLRGVAALRLGVAWVPVIQLALGGGARYRSAARLRVESGAPGGTAILDPDGDDGELVADVVGGLRLGLDHRITPHWTLGASVGAAYCAGLGAPDLQIVDGAILISYVWYP